MANGRGITHVDLYAQRFVEYLGRIPIPQMESGLLLCELLLKMPARYSIHIECGMGAIKGDLYA